VAPCNWVINPLCCPNWDTADPTIKDAATAFATLILWSSTGRQYGQCSVTVRPCGMGSPCGDGTLNWSGWMPGGGSGWVPYNFNGEWFNCGCPAACSCDPRCQVLLPGPVTGVTSVKIGGATIDPSAYRVDNQRWLVRTDGDCWPQCPDFNADNTATVFEVVYLRGDALPVPLANAAGTLACEFIKACTSDKSCRLPSRVQEIARNGVTVSFVDVDTLLEAGLTGISEVDMIIRALNPGKLPYRLRVRTPDIRPPRMVTTP
jgi:hypothetical protein